MIEEPAKIKVRRISDDCTLYMFWCPACHETHSFDVGEGDDKWRFNGDMDKPSFFPSLRYDKCHLILRQGIIEYCGDCLHGYRNMDVSLKEF